MSFNRGLLKQDVPNYQISATASSLFALVGAVSYLEGNYFSTYLAFASALYAGAASANQYGINKSLSFVKNEAITLFSRAKNYYSSQQQPAEETLKNTHKTKKAS